MRERLGVIGLGIMGGAMASNLLEAGHHVTGFDIERERAERLASLGLNIADSVTDVAAHSDLIVLSLPTPSALADVAEELAGAGRRGLVVLECGTFSLEDKVAARDVLGAAGIDLLDTPLSGTGLQAADATLVVYASGSDEGLRAAEPVFSAIGRSTHLLGDFGNGTRMKFIANLLVAVNTLAAAEAHALGAAAGLDPAVVQETIADGVGSSKMFEIRGPMMVEDSYPAAARLDTILKDAGIIAAFARSLDVPTPLLEAALPVYREASESGLGDLDAAALCRYLERGGES